MSMLGYTFYVLFWNINWIQSNLIPYFTCPYKIFCKYIYLVFNLLGIYGWPVIKVVPIILKKSTLKIGYILNYVFCSFKVFNLEIRKWLSILGLNFCDLICDINYTILNSLNHILKMRSIVDGFWRIFTEVWFLDLFLTIFDRLMVTNGGL